MDNSDCRKFVGFTVVTLLLLFTGILLGKAVIFFVLNNELGDIYWGIILPILSFFIMIILLAVFTTYTASWIYFVKTKGRSRWFGLLGLIPIIGPLTLMFLKAKIENQNRKNHYITIFIFINLIIPIIVFFSISTIFSSLKQEIQKINQAQYQSEGRVNAIVKGVNHKK